MKNIAFLILIITVSCSAPVPKPDKLPVIPKPNQILFGKGNLKISDFVTLNINSEALKTAAELFKQEMEGVVPVVLTENKKSTIQLVLSNTPTGEQEYLLEITKKNITITSGTSQGIFYGLQTLRQLLLFCENETETLILPVVTITDSPRFVWRGLMLDESRHFFGKEKVKQLLDLMALHKLNIFHWHLTDVPGWRIEIKQYPKLTTVGGLGNDSDPNAPAQFYTQNEIREIVKYAADRHIEIVPEIDMPGHAAAANRAYPEFSGGGSERYPEFTFNPGKKATYTYLTSIIREITQLFPSKYIHLGGDEVHFGNDSWRTNPDVLQLMKEHNLPDLKAVETYFIQRMADSVKMLDKTVIGWDEIVDHNLDSENSLVMWWRHNLPDKLEAALSNNYQVVLCPRIPLYFDFVQNEKHQIGRKWGGAFAPLELVYYFPPDTLPDFKTHYSQVKGIQANVWTERIQNNERLDYMLNPRLSALAESAWTNDTNKDLEDFKGRLNFMLLYFKKKGIGYYNPFNPENTPEHSYPK